MQQSGELIRKINLKLPSPTAALLIGCVLVGASGFIIYLSMYFPVDRLIDPIQRSGVPGGSLIYGIFLFTNLIVLDSLGIRDLQNVYADLLYIAAPTCLNLVLFSLPALAILGAFRTRLPQVASILILSWLVFYLLAFWVLFPEVDYL